MGKYNKNPPRIAGGIFIWCRKWDSFSDTGGSIAASPGNSKSIHWILFALRDVPFESRLSLINIKKESVAEHELRIWCS